ncbi:MAG: Maf family protein [Bacilli bacterium]|jgi:septum formation protein|nr:Maf family protein [Bacilli bacterium]MDD4063199.1 Maf family protein [Bacilli bacterium]MDD4481839.1 Maf family protein [Bacilli bacterium]MDY0363958.1 Maf family protein [Bacilli bacterium]
MKIVLGSSSPRRSELMRLIGYEFIVAVPYINEEIEEDNPINYVKKIVRKKGNFINCEFSSNIIVCADTIVVKNNVILGKPKSKEDAFKTLKMLQNDVHYVYTAVLIQYKKYKKVFVEKTKVYIDSLTDEEIELYIDTTEPYDKAGSYAIQGVFGKYIKKIEGDYYNVMGLPINLVYREIEKIKNGGKHEI